MLMRFDPFREVERLTQQIWRDRGAVMPMDAWREGDRFVVQFDLPGVDPGTIDLTVEKNVFTVSAERPARRGDGQVLASERPHGSFSRQLFLGEGLDAERIEANYEHGVLTVTLPVAEQAKPRRVEVQSGGGRQAIETGETAAA